MFAHYLELAVRHLRRNPVLTALMIVTLAVGVAASMSTLTVLRAMSADPIPQKSDRLFVPLLDLRPDDGNDRGAEPPYLLSYRDAIALEAAHEGVRESVVYMVAPAVQPERPGARPFFAHGLVVDADAFTMFDIPVVRGAAWTADDDRRAARVAVVRESLAARAFGDVDPIGRSLRLDRQDYTVVGVVADSWNPLPRYYRLIGGPGAFTGADDLFVPLATAIATELSPNGQRSCYGGDTRPGFAGLLASECVWLNLWVELGSAKDAAGYRDFLAGYVADQRKLGRFPRPDNQRLYNVNQWLAANEVVARDSRLQTYLAFGFLIVCLINTVGLMLAKFTARAGEIGVRRALGATRRTVFHQYLTEAGVIGLVGGAGGLGLTSLFLWLMSRRSQQLAALAHLDWAMFATTFVLAIAASLIAGLLPTWRACQVRPAVHLKTQ
jgi:putative ABC transport system permease protein